MTDTDDKTASLLAAIWQRNRALVEERLDLLERTAAAAAGGLIEAQRQEAGGVAHKLAGSLGMYGYDEGTRIARQIEVMLLGDGMPDAVRLGALVVELRRAVFPEG